VNEHQPLLFALVPNFTEAEVARVRDEVEAIALVRSWALAPPEFVDETDSSSCSLPEDQPIRTVGCVLFVPREAASKEQDRVALEDVEAVLEMFRVLSSETHVEVEVQIDETVVGSIEDGVLDRSISQGLLEPWKSALNLTRTDTSE
jgi:hypothetical protein